LNIGKIGKEENQSSITKLDFMSFTKLSSEKFICCLGAFMQSFTKISFSENFKETK
jgi:hypothetical protein